MTMPSDAEVVVERRIAAPPERVFAYFTDRDRWLAWMGADAVIEPRPGGVFRMDVMGDGEHAAGRFVEVVPDRRIVFTWGWETPGSAVPPGASLVEIDLIPAGAGETLVRLRHRGLPAAALPDHDHGWTHFLGRLVAVVEPGPRTPR